MANSTEIIYELKDRIESFQSDNKDDYINFVSIIVNYKLQEVFEKMLMKQLITKFYEKVGNNLITKASIINREFHTCTYQGHITGSSKLYCCPLHFEEIIGFRSDFLELEYIKLKKIDVKTLKYNSGCRKHPNIW